DWCKRRRCALGWRVDGEALHWRGLPGGGRGGGGTRPPEQEGSSPKRKIRGKCGTKKFAGVHCSSSPISPSILPISDLCLGQGFLALDRKLQRVREGSKQALIFLLASAISSEAGIQRRFALRNQSFFIDLQLLLRSLYNRDLLPQIALHLLQARLLFCFCL